MMLTPELTTKEKVRNIIENKVTTMEDTRRASYVIDYFEKSFPQEKDFVYCMRDSLCDRTFELYRIEYPTIDDIIDNFLKLKHDEEYK